MFGDQEKTCLLFCNVLRLTNVLGDEKVNGMINPPLYSSDNDEFHSISAKCEAASSGSTENGQNCMFLQCLLRELYNKQGLQEFTASFCGGPPPPGTDLLTLSWHSREPGHCLSEHTSNLASVSDAILDGFDFPFGQPSSY